MASTTTQKSLGAFYTEEPAANRLVTWAIRGRKEAILDPSCGDGAFLAASIGRLSQLGCISPRVCGVDVSSEALAKAQQRARSAKLVQGDFFDITPQSFSGFDCVVGNPPFIRYQTFNGDTTSKGHLRAMEAGVRLPRLASSWAPFVVHAARFLRPGGRLAMVMPAELGHAMYARAVLNYIVQHFGHIEIQMFREKLFGEINESTVFLLCEGFGEQCRNFNIVSADELLSDTRVERAVDIGSVESGSFRLTHYLLPESVRRLYTTLAKNRRVRRLGQVADVGIGYVTGANYFFHLSDREQRELGIGTEFLRPAVLNLRGTESIAYSRGQWTAKRRAGDKVYLLALPAVGKDLLPGAVQHYLHRGEVDGIADRYKCRVRKFWYSVPHIRVADAFLSYMSGEMPFLVTNPAGLVAPNTIHLLQFVKSSDTVSYAASWRNSLTRLSCELEGHALGGGLFKLEPSEAENVLVVGPCASHARKLIEAGERFLGNLDEHLFDLGDRYLLKEEIGLSNADCASLREAAMRLEQWRKHQ